MNAWERRIVGVCDISGAFLQAYMDDYVIVMFEDEMINLLVDTEPSYVKYVHITKSGKERLCIICMRAAQLWWNEFSKYLVCEIGSP